MDAPPLSEPVSDHLVAAAPRLLGVRVTPLTQRRWRSFKHNRRGYVSLWIFLTLFVLSLFAEVIANDKPILMTYQGRLYAPMFRTYPETAFGGQFKTAADYRDPARRSGCPSRWCRSGNGSAPTARPATCWPG